MLRIVFLKSDSLVRNFESSYAISIDKDVPRFNEGSTR